MSLHFPSFIGLLVAIGLASIALAPRARSNASFFAGQSADGEAPGVLTLTFSQVTTWIFARSLLNVGILGYLFGIAGAVAYTAYYGSFLTGSLIVDRLRAKHGATNVQGFIERKFGGVGTACFNLLVSLRLLSEVFANLLVVGIVFGAAGGMAANAAILAVAVIALGYSMTGGLQASLRTDVLQTSLLLAIIAVPTFLLVGHDAFSPGDLAASSPDPTGAGWVLLVVALLQVLSYPLHDPVMMDRGFLSDRETTRRSFFHAFWISSGLILAFGMLGVFAGLHVPDAGGFLLGMEEMFGTTMMLMIGLALVLSAASTMDSTFSSVSKLVVMDMGVGDATPRNGRIAMGLFAIAGLLLVYFGTDDLFAAVAVSGTASLFLAPVIVFSILMDRAVALWSYLATFAVAMLGSALYFLEDSGYVSAIEGLTGLGHSYSQLLVMTIIILAAGFIFFALGLRRQAERAVAGGRGVS